MTEDKKIMELNKRLDLENYQKKNNKEVKLLNREHIILCHTPLGEDQLVDIYNHHEGYMLAMGPLVTQKPLAENYGFKRYVTTEEFAAIFPEVSYYVRFEYPNPARL